ncbi:MAG: OmpA family protein [Desulfuromonadales bacterium]|nr:OmpA family protein [Desulfuromonadales bacterium]
MKIALTTIFSAASRFKLSPLLIQQSLKSGRWSGLFADRSTRLPEHPCAVKTAAQVLRQAFAVVCLALCMTSVPLAATLPGTLISNTASATYDLPGSLTGSSTSNPVDITTTIQRTPSEIRFLQYAPAFPSGYQDIDIPVTYFSLIDTLDPGLTTNPVDQYGTEYTLPATTPVIESNIFHGGQPIIIRLTDVDQDTDPDSPDQILVTIVSEGTLDKEILLLAEDGNTGGTFYGYILTELSNTIALDGVLALQTGSQIRADYVDAVDGTDSSTIGALVDPFGIVFNSITGNPVDGAYVTLYDVTNGDLPATDIRDDFGNLGYNATVLTGDSSLGFSQGQYRFPLIEPGRNYRLGVVAPAGYIDGPSSVPPNTLRSRFGSQYVIVDGASFGVPFPVDPGPAINIDIPIDPESSGLWVEKSVNRAAASIGDFIAYSIEVSNLSSTDPVGGVSVEDRLPVGFRYQQNSIRINSQNVAEPTIASNGRDMVIVVGDLAPGESVQIKYVVEISSGARLGDAINTAIASDILGTQSNQASAQVAVRDEFFRNKAFIMGQVKIGSCDEPDIGKEGLSNTRIYLEDGTYVVTDENGKYHFEGIEPGLHVVQLDINSLPQGHEALNCEDNNQFANRSFSKFIDIQGGSMWVADFYVAPKPPPTGTLTLKMSSTLEEKTVAYAVDIETSGVGTNNNRLTVILPKQTQYIVGSSVRDSDPIEDPLINGPAAIFNLDDLEAGQQTRVAFTVGVDADLAAGEHPTKAMLLFDTPAKSNQKTQLVETAFTVNERINKQPKEERVTSNFPSFVADVQEHDKEKLAEALQRASEEELIRVEIAGHTDNVPIADRSRHIFSDNLALSEARAKNTGKYIAEQVGMAAELIETSGHSKNIPVTRNETEAGRAMNRRAEVTIHSEEQTRSIELMESTPVSQAEQVATQGAHSETEAVIEIPEPPEASVNPPALTAEWLDSAKPGYEWL